MKIRWLPAPGTLHPLHGVFVSGGFSAFQPLFAGLVWFGASFFYNGLTRIILTISGIATLAWRMFLTVKVDWRVHFRKRDKQATVPV